MDDAEPLDIRLEIGIAHNSRQQSLIMLTDLRLTDGEMQGRILSKLFIERMESMLLLMVLNLTVNLS